MMQDSAQVYGSATRGLHWAVALLVVAQLGSVFLGWVWEDNLYTRVTSRWHTTIGVSVLGLMALRILWAITQCHQRPRHAGRLQRLAIWGHVVMYALLVLMPLSGVLLTWGLGYGVYAFGHAFFTGADASWAAAFGRLHGTFAWLLAAMILGHVGMAMHHHFGRRDDTLRRMLGRPEALRPPRG